MKKASLKTKKTSSRKVVKIVKKSTKRQAKITVYDPAKIEKKWQKKWESSKIYRSKEDTKKAKCYVLDMFPYPSGEGLHVGHPKGYIATDIISRYNRMKGHSVLHPMGFDAFGLPAENYALKTKTNPADSVKKNVARYKKQLEIMGFDYDWSREINTTDPKYYKWTQWIFLQILKKGLAYESFEPINWCPSCKTGLANEDVEDGRCERCGTLVEKKPMRQWVLKITDYAERLLNDLDAKNEKGEPMLDWPESIKTLQRNWIGRSEGALIKFKSMNSDASQLAGGISHDIEVFTTRPDTLFGVTYVVLAPEHKLMAEFLKTASNKKEIEEYIAKAKGETEMERTDAKKEKTGVELKGIKAINPANKEEVSIWIADYVLADYGTGAVMAVPAHDDRDWDFAKKYGLPVKDVVLPFFENKAHPYRKDRPMPTVPREHIDCIVRDPKTDLYAALKWDEKFGWTTLVGGGIEEGESPKDAGIREFTEEAGYKNLKCLGEIAQCFGGGFAVPKDVNRLSHLIALSYELENDEHGEVGVEELNKHKLVWLPKEKMHDFLNVESSQYLWDVFEKGKQAYIGEGVLVNSGAFNGKDSASVKKDITSSVGGEWVTKYKLREWVFSRQRYWGEPIPVIHCENCAIIDPAGRGIVPVPEKDLPVILPKVKSYEPTGTGESPLAAISKWVNVKCPVCKGPAKRETNTMPQWAGSSWYHLRYEDPKNNKVMVDPKKEKYWSPVDVYVGGAEHATRHLIYARFWHKFLYDQDIVSTIEPFIKLQHVGLIMGEDGRKMSKRFGNVINPDDIVKNFGADALRVYEMFMGPFDQQIAWSTSSIVGSRRFIERVWKLREKIGNNTNPVASADEAISPSSTLRDEHRSDSNETLTTEGSQTKMKLAQSKGRTDVDMVLHKTIKKVTDDIENMRFNTAISALMIAVNELEKSPSLTRKQYEMLLQLVAPFAPHITEELWAALGNKKSIHISEWPVCDLSLTVDDEVTIMVQVNGKIRGSFVVPVDTSKEVIEQSAKDLENVKKWLEGKNVIKVIVVPKKLVNIVVV